jgi:hypothetical protein
VTAPIAIVGCGKAKRSEPCEARDLYTSTLFTLSRRYAETCDEWRIVSALHGLLRPEDVLGPYELRLAQMPTARKQWAERCVTSLLEQFQGAGPLEVFLLCGVDYAEPLRGELEGAGVVVREPLAGLGLGKRLAWLSREIAT